MHWIHARLLAAAAERADLLRVGVGSPGLLNARNPFSLEDRLDMVREICADLPCEATVFAVPDLGHGPRWAAQVKGLFGPLDRFVSANGYVRRLLEPTYRLAHPLELIPPSGRAPIGGAEVRLAMARGEDWDALVPPSVAALLRERGLVNQFRREHGLALLSDDGGSPSVQREESDHVRLG